MSLKSTKTKSVTEQYNETMKYLNALKNDDAERFNTIAYLLTLESENKTSILRMQSIIPPHACLNDLISVWDRLTNIPIELPVFSFFSSIAAYLAMQEIEVYHESIDAQYTDLWHVLLAQSGAAKTFSVNLIQKDAPNFAKSNMSSPAGGAAFMQTLAEINGKAYWVEDEIAQIQKQLETIGSPLCDVKTMLLKAYGNKKISRARRGNRKTEIIEIEKPIINILGINTFDSYIESLSKESIGDGFSQRWLYVVADKSEKDVGDFAIYDVKQLQEEVSKIWSKVTALELHKRYTISDEALELFKESFKKMWSGAEVNESFFRRIMFTAFKYSLVIHVLLCKTSDVIDCEDISYACRVCSLHLSDTAKVISEKVGSSQRIKQQVKRIKEEEITTPRQVQRSFGGKTISAESAKTLLEIAKVSPEIEIIYDNSFTF